MNNHSSWIKKYGDLLRLKDMLDRSSIRDSLAVTVIEILLMLVEDKIKEAE